MSGFVNSKCWSTLTGDDRISCNRWTSNTQYGMLWLQKKEVNTCRPRRHPRGRQNERIEVEIFQNGIDASCTSKIVVGCKGSEVFCAEPIGLLRNDKPIVSITEASNQKKIDN